MPEARRSAPPPWELPGAAALYVAAVLAAVWLGKGLDPEGIGPYLVALLPLAASLLLITAGLRRILIGDELEQRAAAISAIITLSVFSGGSIAWGILEAFANAPSINALYWGVSAIAVWAVCHAIVLKRYQ